MTNPLANKILFLKVKNKDPEAYAEFYDLYVGRIYRFVFFKVNSRPEAQDLTSEVFLKLWHHIREGREVRSLNAFVYMIARNCVIDFYRRRARESEYSLPEEQAEQIAGEPEMPDFENQELLKGLDNLKDEYKEVIVLRFLDELGIGEIAEVVNKSKGAVRVLLHRAVKALKENLHHLR